MIRNYQIADMIKSGMQHAHNYLPDEIYSASSTGCSKVDTLDVRYENGTKVFLPSVCSLA